MTTDVTVQFITGEPCVPGEDEILQWAGSALAGNGSAGEVTIRIIGEEEMQALNYKWRNIDRPTNVLSFPLGGAACPLLGDIAVCAPVIKREAARQGKPLDAHWAHVIIHGILHLKGYAHKHDKEAEIMEKKETALMEGLGFPDPYAPETEKP